MQAHMKRLTRLCVGSAGRSPQTLDKSSLFNSFTKESPYKLQVPAYIPSIESSLCSIPNPSWASNLTHMYKLEAELAPLLQDMRDFNVQKWDFTVKFDVDESRRNISPPPNPVSVLGHCGSARGLQNCGLRSSRLDFSSMDRWRWRSW